jgi:hypothetical protein
MSSRPAFRVISRAGRLLICLVFAVSLFKLNFMPTPRASADGPKLLRRVLQLDSSLIGATTRHTFRWKWPSNDLVGSIKLQYCTRPDVGFPCIPVPGVDASAATLTTQIGETGFSILSQTADTIILTRPVLMANSALDNTYSLSNIVNPSDPGEFFVRINTYTSTNATGPFSTESEVVNSAVIGIDVNAIVPPILHFCVAEFISDYCQTSGRTYFDYGILDETNTRYAQTQMQIATNARNGYVIVLAGNTMTSGNSIIDALSVPTASSLGESQFGINMRANTTPPIGQDVTGLGNGAINPDYDTPDMFKFNNGDTLASTASGSFYNIYTVSYVVNVPPDLPAGVYNTTVTYIATGSF